jgi:hypothetical protein
VFYLRMHQPLMRLSNENLKKGGISLEDQSKVHININPERDYIIQDGEQAIIIP